MVRRVFNQAPAPFGVVGVLQGVGQVRGVVLQQCAGQPFQAGEVEVAAGRRQVQDRLFIGQAHQGHAQWGCPVAGLGGEPGQRGVLVDAAVLAQVLEVHRQRAGFVDHLHRVAQAGHGHQARAQDFTAGHQGLQAVVQCSDVQRL